MKQENAERVANEFYSKAKEVVSERYAKVHKKLGLKSLLFKTPERQEVLAADNLISQLKPEAIPLNESEEWGIRVIYTPTSPQDIFTPERESMAASLIIAAASKSRHGLEMHAMETGGARPDWPSSLGWRDLRFEVAPYQSAAARSQNIVATPLAERIKDQQAAVTQTQSSWSHSQ